MARSNVSNRYQALIESIFQQYYGDGVTEFEFARPEIKEHAKKLDIDLPENLGDVIYAMRFRTPLPQVILETQPEGREWIIELAGRSRYRFKLGFVDKGYPEFD